MSDLNELLERVKAATGPDRKIDIALAQAFYATVTYRISDEGECEELADGLDDAFGMTGWFPTHQEIPTYTASIDAALALVERVLPNTMKRVCDDENGIPRAELVTEPMGYSREHGATWPLALLAALLQALTNERTNVQ